VLGFMQPGVFIEAREIERVDAETFRIRGGRFTSCSQPTPRWSFSASTATLEVDDKITAANVVFRVKSVPALYFPFFAYPIQEDQRSSGFLFPHFTRSDAFGYEIGTAYFWAMGRSADQTFYYDYRSRTGYGFGHEFRYALRSPSRGNFRSFFFREEAGWEYDLRWNALQMLPGNVRASVNANLNSDLTFQERYNDRLDIASNRQRSWSVNLQRSLGITNVQLLGEATDTFFGNEGSFARRRRIPALIVNQSPRRFRGTGLVFSYQGRAENLEFGNQDLVNRYTRYDLHPRLSRPLAAPFLQVTPEVALRYTAWGTSNVDEDGGVDLSGPSVQRRYFEGNVDMRGPTLSRVFDTPGNFYSDRFKHVIGPEVVWTYRTRVDDFSAIPRFDGHDQITGTNQVRYSLVQRFYAKRPGATGKPEPYEFLSWRVGQTYYVQLGAGDFDPNYYSAFRTATGAPSHISPIQSRLLFRPTTRLSSNFDLEYNANFRMLTQLSLAATVEYPRVGLQAVWSRSRRAAVNPENRVVNSNAVRGGARVVLWPGKLALDGGADYDILNQNLLQVSSRLRYDVQCCGFQVEMLQYDFGSQARQDRQFRFSIELANIGSIGNFMGGPEERR
jgi:LPS-assembly protein